jgi:predicted kinase
VSQTQSRSKDIVSKVIVLIGLPGSGKSTWARHQGHTILSSDEMRLTLSGDETNQAIHGKVFGAIRHLLKARLEIGGQTTIIDATNIRRRDRKPWLKLALTFNAETEAVFFHPPLETTLQRNRQRTRVVPEDVIRAMAARLQPPTKEEGFHRVTTISA